tara:strand:+ start:87 stop:263 length:177 start_codon:yes stop_codon:yes gene_type:complete
VKMSRILQPSNEGGLEDSHVEGVAGERDSVPSDNPLNISKLKVVVNGKVIYSYGGKEK